MNLKKMNKLISVIIPVFNVADYLEQTLICILAQTYTNWELIMVDDGSTDGSLEIEKGYCKKDKRVKCYQRDILPKGAPSCRNIGMKLAKGDYIIYLDSDDIIPPYCFEQRINYIEANDCDFAVFPMMGYYEKFFDADGMIYGYKTEGDDVYSFLSRMLPFVVVSNIYKRKSLLDKHIVWDVNLKLYQDSDYNLQAIRSGMTYKMSNLLPDYFYRLSAQNSICKQKNTKSRCENQIFFIEKQTVLYGEKAEYRKALRICAAQTFQIILDSESREETIEKFVSIKLFDGNRLLRTNLKIVTWLSLRTNNPMILSVAQILLLPSFFLPFKMAFKRWYQRNRVLYKELGDRFLKETAAE